MKKLLFVFLVIMVGMIYVSCSKDDDKETKQNNYKEMIVGKWAVSYSLWGEEETDIITFNGKNMYFEAVCSLSTYRGEYSVVENVVSLNESTGKYPLDVIVIKKMTEDSFIGQADYVGEIKGKRIN